MTRKVLKNFSMFVDGQGYAGMVEDFTPPVLTSMVEDVRLGGMDAPVAVTMGMEKLESSFTMLDFSREVLKLWGLHQGAIVPFNLRGVLEDNEGTVVAVRHEMRGKLRKIDWGTWKAGEIINASFEVDVYSYRYFEDGAELINVDPENMVKIIDGVDQLAAQRSALGV